MVDILESKVVGTNKETWYKLVGTSEDTKPIGEFPAGTGHTVANGSRFYEVDTEIGYELKEEGWIAVGQNARLPDVTAEDNGKVLSVVEGNWDKALPTNELPDVTEDDNDKLLKVVNGAWDKAEAGGDSNVAIYGALLSLDSDTYTLTLGHSKTAGDIMNDENNGKMVVIKAAMYSSGIRTYHYFYKMSNVWGTFSKSGSRVSFLSFTFGTSSTTSVSFQAINLSST